MSTHAWRSPRTARTVRARCIPARSPSPPAPVTAHSTSRPGTGKSARTGTRRNGDARDVTFRTGRRSPLYDPYLPDARQPPPARTPSASRRTGRSAPIRPATRLAVSLPCRCPGVATPVCLCAVLYIANGVGDHRANFPIVLVGKSDLPTRCMWPALPLRCRKRAYQFWNVGSHCGRSRSSLLVSPESQRA
jgi:hypothetical protein